MRRFANWVLAALKIVCSSVSCISERKSFSRKRNGFEKAKKAKKLSFLQTTIIKQLVSLPKPGCNKLQLSRASKSWDTVLLKMGNSSPEESLPECDSRL